MIRKKSMLLILPLLASAGCAAGPDISSRIAVASEDRIEVSAVHSQLRKDGVLVTGRVHKSGYRPGPVAGALRVTGYGKDGGALVSRNVRWAPFGRRHQGSHFAVTLKRPGPVPIDHVTVEYDRTAGRTAM